VLYDSLHLHLLPLAWLGLMCHHAAAGVAHGPLAGTRVSSHSLQLRISLHCWGAAASWVGDGLLLQVAGAMCGGMVGGHWWPLLLLPLLLLALLLLLSRPLLLLLLLLLVLLMMMLPVYRPLLPVEGCWCGMLLHQLTQPHRVTWLLAARRHMVGGCCHVGFT
jgi:hypothetical protein